MQINKNIAGVNNVNKLIVSQKKELDKSSVVQNFGNMQLPSVDVAGLSQVNSDLPVSYVKIAEIPIPGLDQKASLFKLSNGQKVVIAPKKGPTHIATSFNVGAFNEPDHLRGISHYIEHNLFNGSKNLAPGEYDKKITELGGYTNAFTSFAETRYYLNLQLLKDNSLEDAIKLNAYQTQFPTFPTDQLEREKEPVKSEIDMVADDFSSKAYSLMIKNMFGIESTSEDLVIGTKENINNLNREKVFDYFNTWYSPDNAITAITGDVDVDETIKLVSKYYNKKLDTSKHQQRQYMDLIPSDKPHRVDFKQKNDPNAFITMGFPVPANTSQRDFTKIDVMLSILESKNSKLSKSLDKYGISFNVGKEQLSSDVKAPKILTTMMSLPEEQVEDVMKLIYEGITDLKNNPPSADELNTIINAKIKSMNNLSEYSENVNSTLIHLVNNNDLNYFNDATAVLKTITPQEVSEIASKILDLNKVSIAVAHPEKTSDAQIIQNHKMINTPKQVSFGKSLNVSESISEDISKIKEYTLMNNMKLLMAPVDNAADTSLHISFDTQTINNDVYRSQTMVLSELLNRGSYYRNDVDYTDAMNKLCAGVGFSTTPESISLSASIPSENLSSVLPLLKETILTPNFTQQEFDRAKKLVRESLVAERKSPDTKLDSYLNPNSKYYADVNEQIEALDKMTLADCINLHNRIFYNSQAIASFTGQIDKLPNLQTELINGLSQNLPMFRSYVPGLSYNINLYKPNDKEVILTDVEENAQASIIQSYQYKTTGNIEDNAKIQLLNYILGAGGMSSRLFTDLRVNEKLAYRVRSSTSRENDMGSINLSIMTSTDPVLTAEASPQNINKSLNGFKRNIERLKTELVSQEELESMKTKLKAEILDAQEGNSLKASGMMTDAGTLYGQNYLKAYLSAIDNITVQDIKATANYVFANKPVTSIVASQRTLDELKL